MSCIAFKVPTRTVSEANRSRHEHWSSTKRRVDAQRQATWVAWHTRPDRRAISLPAVVTLTRLAPRDLDDDNLRSALKHVRDELAACLGLPVIAHRGGWPTADDRDPRVEWRYGQHRGGAREYAIGVLIEERPR